MDGQEPDLTTDPAEADSVPERSRPEWTRLAAVSGVMLLLVAARWWFTATDHARVFDAFFGVVLAAAVAGAAWWAGTAAGLTATGIGAAGYLAIGGPMDGLARIHGAVMLALAGLALSLLIGSLQNLRSHASQQESASKSLQYSYRMIFDRSPMPMWLYDLETLRFVQVNDAAIAEFGYSRADLSKMTILDVSPPEQVKQVKKYIRENDSKVVQRKLWKLRKKDGTIVHVEVTSNYLMFRGRPARMALGVDVTERQRIETDMRQAQLSAEAASRARSNFLAMLSHELRTPLTPVVTTLGELLEDDLPQTTRTHLEMIQRNVELEARLIDDLLDLTRAERNLMRLSMECVDVHELIRRVAQICEADIEAGHLTLVLKLEARLHHAAGDPARIQQVLWNLLKNAATYTPSGGKIQISTRLAQADLGVYDSPSSSRINALQTQQWKGLTGSGSDSWIPKTPNSVLGRIVIEVSDTGIGLAASDLDRIFDPFERGKAAEPRGRGRGGLGLGLAISRSIAEAHGGWLTVRSEGPGKGSTFALELAVNSPPSAAVAAAAQPPAAALDRSLKILLVDDNADTLAAIERSLKRRSHQVTTADSLASALHAVETGPSFDLIISDIELPDGSGHDLMRAVRAAGHSHVLGIALSGFGSITDMKASRAAGFVLHITKPVTNARLQEAIQQAWTRGPAPAKSRTS